MNKYYLLAVLDDASQQRLHKMSDKLIEQGFDYTRYTPYHITLWDSDKIDEQTIAHFVDICSSTPVFQTMLGYIGLFGLAVVFIAPMPSQALITLEQKICGKINDTPVGWAPHVTIRMGEPEYIKQVVPKIAELFSPFYVQIDRIELYECGESYANHVHSFNLCGK